MLALMLDMLEYDFMQRAFLAGLVIGIVAPVIGTFLVVRRYTRLSDTLAHVALAGVAGGLLLGFSPVAGAVAVCVLAAVGVEWLRLKGGMAADAALAMFLWGGLALAVVLISRARGFNADLFGYLFGSIAAVSSRDLIIISSLGAVVIFTVGICFRQFFLVSFDEEMAEAEGLRARAYNLLLVVLAALVVALSLRVVGLLLVGALMVIPVLSAMQVARSFGRMLILGCVFSIVSVLAGLLASYAFDIAAGGTIVLVSVGLFGVTIAIKGLMLRSG